MSENVLTNNSRLKSKNETDSENCNHKKNDSHQQINNSINEQDRNDNEIVLKNKDNFQSKNNLFEKNNPIQNNNIFNNNYSSKEINECEIIESNSVFDKNPELQRNQNGFVNLRKFKTAYKPNLLRTKKSGIISLDDKADYQYDRIAEESKLNSISESQQKLNENNINTNNLNFINNNFLDGNNNHNNYNNLNINHNKYKYNNFIDNYYNYNDKKNKSLNKFANNKNNLNLPNQINAEKDANMSNKITGSTQKIKQDNEVTVTDKKKSIKKTISEFLDKNITALIMTIATIYALVLTDLNVIFFSPDVDIFFNILSGIVFMLFLIEFVLSVTTKDDYNGTFFFWLDLLSIFSMVLNIDWIIYPLLESFSDSPSSDTSLSSLSIQKMVKNLSGVVKLTRVTRLLRIIRIIRLIRLLKLYKNVMIAKKNLELKKARERMSIRKLDEIKQKIVLTDDSSNENSYREGEEEEEEHEVNNTITNKSNLAMSNKDPKKRRLLSKCDNSSLKKKEELSETPYEDILSESKISVKLSSSMTKLIISLIMMLLLTFPYMSYELYSDSDLTNYSILLKYIENYFGLSGELTPEMNFTFYNFLNKTMDENYPIINISYNSSLIWENPSLINENFRSDEINYFYHDDGLAIISYGTLFDNKLNSVLNIMRTVYVALILGWMIVKLDEDSKTHALYPLENIMSIIQTISRDPIGSRNTQKLHNKSNKNFLNEVELKEINKKEEDNNNKDNLSNNKNNNNNNNKVDNKNLEKNNSKEKRRQKALNKKERNKLKSKSNYEVKTIEAAVIKISALLAIGFGEAGEAIIKHNLKPGTQEVNPMVKGRKKIAIFGFCDIRQFPIVNECLQERTMSFVNQIANIVHTSVDLFMGAANKNIGDAFLCVWKFRNDKKKKIIQNQNNTSHNNYNNINNNNNIANENDQDNKSFSNNNNDNISNNFNSKIFKKNNFLKKTISLENKVDYSNNKKQDFSELDNEINEKSYIYRVENIIQHDDQVKQSLSDNNILKNCLSDNSLNYISKDVNNKINVNSTNNQSLTANNNFNYNINIKLLNNTPNNNIKININNNNYINNNSSPDANNPNTVNTANFISAALPQQQTNANSNAYAKKITKNLINSQQNFISTNAENMPNCTEFRAAMVPSTSIALTSKLALNALNPLKSQTQLANLKDINQQKPAFKISGQAKEGTNLTEAADRALLGYLHIIKCINNRPNILVYRTDEDILTRIPNYKVKMGFGLHIGWAIEGAIGSHHKIDASYLSPNVNMSARLEAATKQYGVTILISGDMFDSLSSELKEICRLIDVVTVKGSNKPIKLYTVDLNLDLTPSEKDQPNINLSENRKIYEDKKERFYKAIEESGGSIGCYMKTKNSFKELLEIKRPSAFKKVFNNAMNNYIKGDWEKAKKYLNRALELSPTDGPSKTIFKYLSKFDFKVPLTWKGFRELSSK